MNIPFQIGKNRLERGEYAMSKGDNKEHNKKNVNLGTKTTENGQHQEKSNKNKRDTH